MPFKVWGTITLFSTKWLAGWKHQIQHLFHLQAESLGRHVCQHQQNKAGVSFSFSGSINMGSKWPFFFLRQARVAILRQEAPVRVMLDSLSLALQQVTLATPSQSFTKAREFGHSVFLNDADRDFFKQISASNLKRTNDAGRMQDNICMETSNAPLRNESLLSHCSNSAVLCCASFHWQLENQQVGGSIITCWA